MSDEIKPQYGFQLCSADDPARTHWLTSSDHHWLACGHSNNCHKFKHQKPILLPDGKRDGESAEWELVKEIGVVCIGDVPLWSKMTHFNQPMLSADACVGATARNAILETSKRITDDKIMAFARRKASPRTDGWVAIPKGSAIPKNANVAATIENGGFIRTSLVPQSGMLIEPEEFTHYLIWPAPPAPEKPEVEKLADEYVESRNIRNSGYETAVHRGFIAGYEAGRKG